MTNFNHSCSMCYNCHKSCATCPMGVCEISGNKYENLKRINKQVSMASSQSLLHKKTLFVSQMVGESADPTSCLQAGGPGDLSTSIQKSSSKNSYKLRNKLVRTAYKGNCGVDKKHGSYERYLARKVGGMLRKEPRINQYLPDNSNPKKSYFLTDCFKICNNRVPQNKNACGNSNSEPCKGCGNLSVKHPSTNNACCKKKCIMRKKSTNITGIKSCK